MGRILRERKKDTTSGSCLETAPKKVLKSRGILTENSSNIIVKTVPVKSNKKVNPSCNGETLRKTTAKNLMGEEHVDGKATVTENGLVNNDVCSVTKMNERLVLVDQTNSSVKNKMTPSSKSKNRVHFSSKDDVRRITQRRVSDFFHNVEEYHKCSPKTHTRVLKPKRFNYNSGTDYENQMDANNSICSTITKDTKNHVPVYKLPILNGHKSFCLTPPSVKDKGALYEFEVDENEPIVPRRRRRMIKTYKKRKRLRKIDDNLISEQLDAIPQRTMALRNDDAGDHARIDYNEHLDESNIVDNVGGKHIRVKPVQKHKIIESCKKKNPLSQLKGNGVPLSEVKNKSKSNKLENKHIGNANCANGLINIQPKSPGNLKNINHINNSSVIRNNLNNSVVNDKSVIARSEVKNSLPEHLGTNNEHVFANVIISSSPLKDTSACSSVFQSPMPDYSRIDGVKVGPIYTPNKMNSSDADYSNNFVRGITASTPYRTINTPRRTDVSNICQVRLSGGEFSNVMHSLNQDSDDEEFYGFDNVTEVPSAVNSEHSKQKSVIDNEPVQKISVHEVISLLKREVGSHKPKVKSKVTFQPIFKSPIANSSYSGKFAIDSVSDSSQPSVAKYFDSTVVTNDSSHQSEDGVQPSDSFTKPPRRSYTIATPRKMKRANYIDSVSSDEEGCPKKEEIPKKPQKRVHKISKKEKEIERIAAMINSQFMEVDKFDLVVE